MSGAAFRSVTTLDNSTALIDPMLITKPTGTVDGDLLIAAIGHNKTVGVTPDAGWTLLDTAPTYQGATWNDSVDVYYKFASSEPASSSWKASTLAIGGGYVAAYIPTDSTVPASLASGGYVDQGTTGTTATKTITAETNSGGNQLLIFVYAGKGHFIFGPTTPPASPFVERASFGLTGPSNDNFLALGDEPYTSAAQYPARTFAATWSGSNNNGITIFRIINVKGVISGADHWAWAEDTADSWQIID